MKNALHVENKQTRILGVYSFDANVAQIDTEQRVGHFWKAACCRKPSDGSPKYKIFPEVVKVGLILAQMNKESERSLSVNKHCG